MGITHIKEIRDKMKRLKCVRKPHPHTATHGFSKLYFLPIMVVYAKYFTLLEDRIMLNHHEKSQVCASARSHLSHPAQLTLAKEMCKNQPAAGTCTGDKVRPPFWK